MAIIKGKSVVKWTEEKYLINNRWCEDGKNAEGGT